MKHLRHLFTALSLLCATIATAYDFEVGGIYYNITNSTDKTVEVTEGSSYYTGSVVIPESIEYDGITYNVTCIGSRAFMASTELTSITIPNSVTSIGDYAFNGCTSLKYLHIEDGTSTLSLGVNYSASSGYYGKGLFRDCALETL